MTMARRTNIVSSIPSLLLLPILFAVACGHRNSKSRREVHDSSKPNTTAELGLLELSDNRLGSFVVKVHNCASGFSRVFDTLISGDVVQLYEGDRNCIAGLVSFNLEGATWRQVGGNNNGYYDDGSGRLGQFSNGIETISVSNPTVLPNPIEHDSRASFILLHIQAGTDKQMVALGATGYTGSAKNRAPLMKWPKTGHTAISLVGVDFALPRPSFNSTFVARLECDGDFAYNASDPAKSTCTSEDQSQQMQQYYAQLIDDSPDYRNGSSLNNSDCDALFGGTYPPRGTNIVHVEAANVLNKSLGFNGGMQITLRSTSPSVRVGNKPACRSYLLLIQKSHTQRSKRTCIWMNVDWATRFSSTSCPTPDN